MVEFHYPWQSYGSGASWRMVLRVDDPPAVTVDTASVSLGARLLVQTTSTLSDSSNENSLSGTLGTVAVSASVSHGSGGGLTQVAEVGPTAVATQYGTPVEVTVNASVDGYNAFAGGGAYWPAAGVVTIPARPFQPPAAPSGVTASRNSDTSHTVTWTNNEVFPSAPYANVFVDRWDNVGGAWVTLASLPPSVTSYTDTTTVADRQYQYRVRSNNSTATSAPALSGVVYTTPAAPGTPAAAKSGSNIVLTFTNPSTVDEGVKVYASQNGGAFALLATVAGADLTSWTHVAPNSAVTWAYKMATYRGALTSAQSAVSNTVQLLAAPNAPTGLGPSAVRDATEPVTLTWTHNPVDTTAQTGFQLRHRAVGSPTWTTVTVTSSASSWTMPAGTYTNPTAAEWQVATKGQHASYSPWSATATLPASTRPTANINTPAHDGSVAASQIAVSWGYFDAEGKAQTAWQVDLLDAVGAVVESKAGAGAATSTTLATVVPDGSSWTVRVIVQDADGMWSLSDTAAITIVYAPPPTPVLACAWNPQTATVSVEITNPPTGIGEVDVHHVDLFRSVDGGPEELIATGMPANTTVTDRSPTVAGTNAYRAVATSALPSTSTSVVVELVTPQPSDGSPSLWLSGGPGLSTVCRGLSNITVTATAGLAEKVLRRYAGRPKPVEHAGVATERAWSVSLDLIATATPAASDAKAWLALANLPGPHLLRTPDLYVRGTLSQVTAPRQPGGAVTSVSFTFTESGDE